MRTSSSKNKKMNFSSTINYYSYKYSFIWLIYFILSNLFKYLQICQMLDNSQHKLLSAQNEISLKILNRSRPNSPALFILLISSLSNRYRGRSVKRLCTSSTVLSTIFPFFFFSFIAAESTSIDGSPWDEIDKDHDPKRTNAMRASVYFFLSFFISSMEFMVERAANKWPSTTLGQNWQANTSQRMQISRTICQSSHWACRGPDRRGHFNRQSFTIRPSSGASAPRTAHSPLRPPTLPLRVYPSDSFSFSPRTRFPLTPTLSTVKGAAIKTPSVDIPPLSPFRALIPADSNLMHARRSIWGDVFFTSIIRRAIICPVEKTDVRKD